MKVNLTSMDFESIRNNLKDYLKKQDYFKDYNFEGSGLKILLDVLAYNSQNNAYLANMLANESEIDTAILRSNVLSRAKMLGYHPKSSTASRAVISIRIEDSSLTQDSLLLPRGTRFGANGDGQQFVFQTLQEYNLNKTSPGVYENHEIEIFEGILKAYSFDVVNTDRRYVIPSKKIDTNTLKVAVYPNDTSNIYEVYHKETTIQKIDSESRVFWVFETDNGYQELQMGDNVFGKRPDINSVIFCEYLDTNGPVANDLRSFTLVGSFAGFENSDISINTMNVSSGGSNPEATSSIKLNAPRFFQSQNRAVTKDDYAAITHEIYPYAKSVAVWGGEESNPPAFGKVFISIIPKSLTKLTSSNKRDLEKKIKSRGIVGIDPKIIDPNIINIGLSVVSTIRAGSNNTFGNISNQIRDVVLDHFNDEFGIFDADFYYSNLVTVIKNSNRAIANVKASIILSMTKTVTDDLEFSFENDLDENTIRSETFDLDGTPQQIVSKDGKLILSGKEIGTVKNGKIVFADISNLPKELTLFATPTSQDLFSGFATAFKLDQSRLSVEVRT